MYFSQLIKSILTNHSSHWFLALVVNAYKLLDHTNYVDLKEDKTKLKRNTKYVNNVVNHIPQVNKKYKVFGGGSISSDCSCDLFDISPKKTYKNTQKRNIDLFATNKIKKIMKLTHNQENIFQDSISSDSSCDLFDMQPQKPKEIEEEELLT